MAPKQASGSKAALQDADDDDDDEEDTDSVPQGSQAAQKVEKKQVASSKRRQKHSKGKAKAAKVDDDDDDDDQKSSRNMYHGATSELIKALTPLVTQTGFIRYHESATGNKLNKELVRKQARFLRALHTVYAPLCFTQKQMSEAVAAVGVSRGWFPSQPTVLQEWSSDVQAFLSSSFKSTGQPQFVGTSHSSGLIHAACMP